jgi:perosamine synthetase
MDLVQTIPLIQPYLGKKAQFYIAECLDSNWVSSRGHFIQDFEQMFADFVGTKHAVAVSNGSVALHLALICLGIKEGDEVIVPDLTFAATINAVLHAHATPVIVDIDPDTWNIAPKNILRAITKKTKAIIPVHLYGYPCNMDEVMKIARDHGLRVIEDAAEAHGAEFNKKKVGSFGDVGTFSFYGNKIITTGEGGMCTMNDPDLYERMLVYRDHGMNKQNRYQHDVVGFNYRMTNPQAALGVAQLEEIDSLLQIRDQLQTWYEAELSNIPGVKLHPKRSMIRPVTWLYTLLIPYRDRLIETMTREHIETRPMFSPMHRMNIYRQYAPSECPVSISVSERGISLPTYHDMPLSYVERVCHVLRKGIHDAG